MDKDSRWYQHCSERQDVATSSKEMPYPLRPGSHEDNRASPPTRARSYLGTNNISLCDHDVLCGRFRAAFNNVGNQKFRVMVSMERDRYAACTTRKGKSAIIKGIIAAVRRNGGRFLRDHQGYLQELSEKETHAKVGHAFRDMVMASKKATSSSRSPELSAENPQAYSPEAEREAVRSAAAALFGFQ